MCNCKERREAIVAEWEKVKQKAREMFPEMFSEFPQEAIEPKKEQE